MSEQSSWTITGGTEDGAPPFDPSILVPAFSDASPIADRNDDSHPHQQPHHTEVPPPSTESTQNGAHSSLTAPSSVDGAPPSSSSLAPSSIPPSHPPSSMHSPASFDPRDPRSKYNLPVPILPLSQHSNLPTSAPYDGRNARASDAPFMSGRVSWFDIDKALGFVRPDNLDYDIFAHATHIHGEAPRGLREGDRVEFSVSWDEKNNKPAITQITALNGGMIPPYTQEDLNNSRLLKRKREESSFKSRKDRDRDDRRRSRSPRRSRDRDRERGPPPSRDHRDADRKPMLNTAKIEQGKIQSFEQKKGYGFVRVFTSEVADAFFHISDCKHTGSADDRAIITIGDEIEFKLRDTRRGPLAYDVTKKNGVYFDFEKNGAVESRRAASKRYRSSSRERDRDRYSRRSPSPRRDWDRDRDRSRDRRDYYRDRDERRERSPARNDRNNYNPSSSYYSSTSYPTNTPAPYTTNTNNPYTPNYSNPPAAGSYTPYPNTATPYANASYTPAAAATTNYSAYSTAAPTAAAPPAPAATTNYATSTPSSSYGSSASSYPLFGQLQQIQNYLNTRGTAPPSSTAPAAAPYTTTTPSSYTHNQTTAYQNYPYGAQQQPPAATPASYGTPPSSTASQQQPAYNYSAYYQQPR